MSLAIYIAIAGAAGSVSRYLLGEIISSMGPGNGGIPFGTLAVNLIGSMLMGLLVAMFTARGEVDSRVRMLLTVGFLGGFTTYSSFALETVTLMEERNLRMASWYIAITVLGGSAACFAGLVLGRRL